jgi:hypothetical protein
MIKKIIYLFVLSLFLATKSISYECNFDKLKPGVTKKSLGEINIFAYGPEVDGIFIKQLSSYDICQKDLSKVHGLMVTLFFFKDSLIKINYENNIPNNNILFDIANNEYKLNFKRNEQQILKKQSEFYSTSKNNNSYYYVVLKANNNQREFLEIIDSSKIEKFENHILKLEESGE